MIWIGLLALVPVCNTFINLFVFRAPQASAAMPSVAILIPARDEAERIGPCLDAALASEGVDLEVIVLDDHSSDATAEIARARAVADPRLRLESAPPLPPHWRGKPHACHVLSTLTAKPLLLFVDADVWLKPDAARRLAPPPGVALVSAEPRQIVKGVIESALVPMINFLVFGYLPGMLMRLRPTWPAACAACGQIVMARADAYRTVGGHAAISTAMHDGLKLARRLRQHGYATDFVQAADLASCRMYESARDAWDGFAKNATEGLATPVALPIWTALLGGGVLAPLAALALAPSRALAAIVALQWIARAAQAYACREPARAVLLFPFAVLLTLALQWSALISRWRGRPVAWRGRSYPAQSG